MFIAIEPQKKVIGPKKKIPAKISKKKAGNFTFLVIREQQT